MKSLSAKVTNRLLSAYIRLGDGKFFSCMRKSFISLIPVFLIGAFSIAIINFPLKAVNDFVYTFWDGWLYIILNSIYQCTFGLASIYLLISVAYRYALASGFDDKTNTLPIMSAIVAVGSYFALLGVSTEKQENAFSISFGDFNFSINLGVQSVLVAMICAALATKLFLKLCLLFDSKFFKPNTGLDVGFYRTIKCILPMVITITTFAIVATLISAVFRVSGIVELISNIFAGILRQIGVRSYGAAFFVIFLQTIFWFFGLHGGNAFDSVIVELFSDVPGEIITKTILDNFIIIGGCGATFSLILAILIFSKNKTSRSIAKGSTLPMVFNINETLIYGLPVMLNPVFFIPFILAPLINFTVVYIVSNSGLVTLATGATMPWTTPVLFSGYLITNSVAGLFLQLGLIVIDVIIYTPFVKLNDAFIKARNARAVNILQKRVSEANEAREDIKLLTGTDDVSAIARKLISEFRYAIANDKVDIYYQPQIDSTGRAVSCEALLRWNYEDDKFLSPPLIIALAKEDNFYDQLNDYVVDNVLKHAVIMNSAIDHDFRVSVNITATHFMNINYIRKFVDKVNELG
ncbi:MAG: PTS transporter subunit EIIC, partial [Christensenellaceae bacterium]|nr:PTS transporter subunit EIIC [Christensenellaceae bacterium]